MSTEEKLSEERARDRTTSTLSNTLYVIFNGLLILAPINVLLHWHNWVISMAMTIFVMWANFLVTVMMIAGLLLAFGISHWIKENDENRSTIAKFFRERRFRFNLVRWSFGFAIPVISFYLCGYYKTAIYNLFVSASFLLIFRIGTFVLPPILEKTPRNL